MNVTEPPTCSICGHKSHKESCRFVRWNEKLATLDWCQCGAHRTTAAVERLVADADAETQRVYRGTIDPERAVEIMKARITFATKYARDHGWALDLAALTFQQIAEIREQPGWQNPLGENE